MYDTKNVFNNKLQMMRLCISALWSQIYFDCLRDLARHFLWFFASLCVLGTWTVPKNVEIFGFDNFLPFLSTVLRERALVQKLCDKVWWFLDWFMFCKTVIWSLWPIVSKGSIKMRPCFFAELKSVRDYNSCMEFDDRTVTW